MKISKQQKLWMKSLLLDGFDIQFKQVSIHNLNRQNDLRKFQVFCSDKKLSTGHLYEKPEEAIDKFSALVLFLNEPKSNE